MPFDYFLYLTKKYFTEIKEIKIYKVMYIVTISCIEELQIILSKVSY